MGLVMVPLQRALLSSYRLAIVTIPLSQMVCLQFATQIGTTHKSTFPTEESGPLFNIMLLGPHKCPLETGICRSSASAPTGPVIFGELNVVSDTR